MQCSEFESRLQGALDERRRPEDDSRLVEHAAVCLNCARVLNAQERLFRGLHLEPQTEALAALPARAVAGAALAPPPRKSSWLYLSAAMVALAASWLVIVGPTISRPLPDPTPNTIVAAPTGEAAAAGPQPEQTVVLATTDPEAYRWLLAELFEQIAAGAELESVDQITGSFRPLATTLNVALDTLLSTLPGTEAATNRGPNSDRAA